MFSPVRARIEDILNSPQQFSIPIYQRDYRWGREEALELIEDLKNYQGTEGENLFLGNFIFQNTGEKKTLVVDGQQRLTTIVILLVACKMRALKLSKHDLAHEIQTKITFTDAATGESKGGRLIASESIRIVFEYITKGSWEGDFPLKIDRKSVKRQTNRLKPIYEYFLEEASKLEAPELSCFLRAIYDSFTVRIDIGNEIDALSIFERTNARGMELEISDLLKNYLFAAKVEGIQDLWSQITDNSGGTILRMLKYFYVSRKGYILKPQLYRKIKDYSEAVGPQEFTKELVEFSGFYRVAKIAEEAATKAFFEDKNCSEISTHQPRCQMITANLQSLSEFGIVQFYPPAYAAIDCYSKNGGNDKIASTKALIRLFQAFEKYHFINNIICERVGNEVEKLYADFSMKFATSDNLPKTVVDLIKELTGKLANEEEFVAKFMQLNYSSDQLPILAYIFDRFNNYALEPQNWVRIYSPDRGLLRRSFNIEHFLPQTPSADLEVKKETLDYVDNIGNLLAISYKTNSRLGNLSPERKIERLTGDLRREVQNLSYVDDFIAEYSADAPAWDKTKILRRAKQMAEKAFREVWKIK